MATVANVYARVALIQALIPVGLGHNREVPPTLIPSKLSGRSLSGFSNCQYVSQTAVYDTC